MTKPFFIQCEQSARVSVPPMRAGFGRHLFSKLAIHPADCTEKTDATADTFWQADLTDYNQSPNKSPEPTAVGACRSAVAVHGYRSAVAQLHTFGCGFAILTAPVPPHVSHFIKARSHPCGEPTLIMYWPMPSQVPQRVTPDSRPAPEPRAAANGYFASSSAKTFSAGSAAYCDLMSVFILSYPWQSLVVVPRFHTPHIPSHSLPNRLVWPRSSSVEKSTLARGRSDACRNGIPFMLSVSRFTACRRLSNSTAF